MQVCMYHFSNQKDPCHAQITTKAWREYSSQAPANVTKPVSSKATSPILKDSPLCYVKGWQLEIQAQVGLPLLAAEKSKDPVAS